VVRYFYAPALAHRVVVEIDIGAFVEAMMWGNLGRWGDVVMDICEAIHISVQLQTTGTSLLTASRGRLLPAVEA
jgi:hypothetical protein